jgi:hypothetical protein
MASAAAANRARRNSAAHLPYDKARLPMQAAAPKNGSARPMRNTTPNLSDGGSFWSRLGQLLGVESRPAAERPAGQQVKVWDGAREVYRLVDLDDRNDPLWHAARSIAGVTASRTRTAA